MGFSRRPLPLVAAVAAATWFICSAIFGLSSRFPDPDALERQIRMLEALERQPSEDSLMKNFNQTALAVFPDTIGPFKHVNEQNRRKLVHFMWCKAHGTCSDKEKRIVVLAVIDVERVVGGIFGSKNSDPSGETVWADALLLAIEDLEHPYLILHANGGQYHERDIDTRIGLVHSLLNDHIAMIIGDASSTPHCFRNPYCAKSEENPGGVEPHKLFIFEAWGADYGHPLGGQWVLTFYPKRDEGFNFLGLTVEHACTQFPVSEPSIQRDKIYVLAKRRHYLHPPHRPVLPPEGWARVSARTGVTFTVGTLEHDDASAPTLPPGFDDLGPMNRSDFLTTLRSHRAVLGLGEPWQPPTPIEALCLGIPFLNPVFEGLRTESDPKRWVTQSWYLAQFGAPWVYNYESMNEDDIVAAILRIKEQPLTGRFIPPELTFNAHRQRISDLINFDWKGLALQHA